MTELKVNLQGSWKRLLAMITVVAMCCTVIYVSPVSAATSTTSKPGESNLTVTTADAPAEITGAIVVATPIAAVTGLSATVAPEEITIGEDAQGTLHGTLYVSASEVTEATATNAVVTTESATTWAVTKADAKDQVTPTDIVSLDQATGKITGKAAGKVILEATVSGVNAKVTVSTKAITVKDVTTTDVTTTTPDKPATDKPTTDKPATDKPAANTDKPAAKDPAKGAVVTVKSTKYKVTNTKKKEVAYQAPKNKKVKKVTVPATVKINGKSYKVTSISNGAFKNCKKLTNVTVGKNVKKIGKAAFQNCKKTKKIVVKTKNLKSVGAKAFKGVPAKAKVDVPNKKKIVNKYKKMFQKAGLNKKCKVK